MDVDAYKDCTTQGHGWCEFSTPHITDAGRVCPAHEEGDSTCILWRRAV